MTRRASPHHSLYCIQSTNSNSWLITLLVWKLLPSWCSVTLTAVVSTGPEHGLQKRIHKYSKFSSIRFYPYQGFLIHCLGHPTPKRSNKVKWSHVPQGFLFLQHFYIQYLILKRQSNHRGLFFNRLGSPVVFRVQTQTLMHLLSSVMWSSSSW